MTRMTRTTQKSKYYQTTNNSDFKLDCDKKFSRSQISGKISKPFWSFCLERAKEVHLLSKDEEPRNIGYSMTMRLDTRKSNFENQK